MYPRNLVEGWFARGFFPKISSLFARAADSVSFSWLDVAIPAALLGAAGLLWFRKHSLLLNFIAGLYLIFFWTWGLNYHLQPLAAKLPFDATRATPEAIDKLARRAASEINRLHREKQLRPSDNDRIQAEAARRIARVVSVIDGSNWAAPARIKTSRLANPWLRAAGIDGVFNPVGHEPVVVSSLLDVERPFVAAHELAHVRGYPDEGDANLIAVFATIMSGDPAVEYSGWMLLWLYLRTRELDALLDPGPSADLRRIFERSRSEQVPWLNNFQTVVLDWFLKANSVREGVRSYSQVVLLAVGTEAAWDRFR